MEELLPALKAAPYLFPILLPTLFIHHYHAAFFAKLAAIH